MTALPSDHAAAHVPPALRARDVAWRAGRSEILRGVGLDVDQGTFAGLIGPNGSGKSSFLRTIYRVIRPHAGFITLDDDDVWKMSERRAAQRTAAVLQETAGEFEFTVEEMVSMGRTPHKGPFDRESRLDHEIVAQALERVGMSSFSKRQFATLSGGEKQRVLIARALAQQAQVLVLDEPTNHLDIRYQLEILELVRGLGVTTLAALHDLNLAAQYCDRIFVVDRGQIVASGAPSDVLLPDLLRDVFGVGVLVQPHPLTGKPHLAFYHRNPGT